jgi:hypothetical protein
MNMAERRAVESTEMKFLRYSAWYILKDQIRNDNIWQKLNIFNLNDRIQQNKKKLVRKCFMYGSMINYPANFII